MSAMRNEYNRQLDRIERREKRLFREHAAPVGGGLLARVEEKIPDKLAGTLNSAFYTAFQALFGRGTKLLGKTIPEKKLRAGQDVREYALRKEPGRKNVRAFHRASVLSGAATAAAATAEGCALGLLGMGLPDIPILTSILLRAVYQTALRYGFPYDIPEERYYILLLLCAALAKGPARGNWGRRADDFGRALDHGERPSFDLESQMKETAKVLADTMLVMKVIQGAPVVGVVGGVSNLSVSGRVTEMADLKYQKRFLEKKRRGSL